MINIGKKIKSLRKKKEMTMREFCKKSKSSPAYLSRIETGKNKNLTLKILQRISNALDVKMEYFFNDYDEKHFLSDSILIKLKKLKDADIAKIDKIIDVFLNK